MFLQLQTSDSPFHHYAAAEAKLNARLTRDVSQNCGSRHNRHSAAVLRSQKVIVVVFIFALVAA